ncbi:hypothetical protein LJB42_003528 [Komagataella kurtzmanii]|nr:hypothetical protein LJB42_003528 [Komagataella kurtzmanii]
MFRGIRALHTSAASLAEKKVSLSFRKEAKGFVKRSKGPGNHKNFINVSSTTLLKKSESHLPDLKPQNLTKNVVTNFPNDSVKALHHLGSFRKGQFNEAFSRPVSLVRDATIRLEKILQQALTTDSTNTRIAIIGESGVGKTTILAQFQSMAKSHKAIVFAINNADNFVDGSSDFGPGALDTVEYRQPMVTRKLIKKFFKANKDELNIPLTEDIKFATVKSFGERKGKQQDLSFKAKENTLFDVLNHAVHYRGDLSHCLHFTFSQLSASNVPVFLTVDNFTAFTQNPITAYRDTKNNRIYFDRFEIPSLILRYIRGDDKFNKGGVLISSSGKHKSNDTLSVALGDKSYEPYAKFGDFDRKLAATLQNLEKFEVPSLNKEEVGSLLQYYLDQGIIHNEKTDEINFESFRDNKFFYSSGNPRELLKSCTLNYY